MGVGVGDGVCRDTMRILMVNEMRHRVKICKRRGSSSSSGSSSHHQRLVKIWSVGGHGWTLVGLVVGWEIMVLP